MRDQPIAIEEAEQPRGNCSGYRKGGHLYVLAGKA